jgi:eukaryotic-like serine/threonine-protein kinase
MIHNSPMRSDLLDAPAVPDVDGDATLAQDAGQLARAAELSRRREQPPAALGGDAIERQIGEGAYGSVWLAREQNTGKLVSIKFYTHRRGLDWSLLNREVEKLAVLYTSRNIIGLLDVGWDSDPPYYVMEYLENGSLASFLHDGPLPVHEAVRIAKSVLHALVHAHGSGILHCDLKPANVLLDADFEPRLCDFGQSRLSDEQDPALGTLFYMAPEQADLKAVPDARWDVYALGALLYQMLCGEVPYRTRENEELIRSAETLEERLAAYRQALRESPRPSRHRRTPGVDKRLADIVDRCLAIDPRKRFPNAQAVLDALEARDRHRTRRPLVALGVVGPALLLVAMASVFVNAMGNAVEHSRQMLTQRAIESNVLSAEILANSLRRELEDREAELERIADDDELRAAIEAAEATGWDDREAVVRLLTSRKLAVNAQRERLGRRTDTSWFLTDAQGYQRWRHPDPEANTIDEYFGYRDYFHGSNYDDDPGTVRAYAPLRQPHISVAFRSAATGQYMIAISVPIWDEQRERVIGILARTTHLSELLADHETAIRGQDNDDVDRVIALVDRRDWELLDHQWMTEENLKDLPDEIFRRLKLSPSAVRTLSRLEQQAANTPNSGLAVADDQYEDPIGRIDPETYGGLWLAAFAPVGPVAGVGDARWTAVVQERRDQALYPIEEMQRSLRRYGLVALIVSGALIGVLWYFVARAMNDRPLPFFSTRSGTSRPSLGTSTVTDGQGRSPFRSSGP